MSSDESSDDTDDSSDESSSESSDDSSDESSDESSDDSMSSDSSNDSSDSSDSSDDSSDDSSSSDSQEPGDNKPSMPNRPGDDKDDDDNDKKDPSKPSMPAVPGKPGKPGSDKPSKPQVPGEDKADKPSDPMEGTVEDVIPASPQFNVPTGANNNLSMISSIRVRMVSRERNRRLSVKSLGEYNLLPDYDNDTAWRKARSPYNTPRLWGQCTWFAWGRFYELYGFSPRFSGNGYECVGQLLAAHGDKFELSDKPAAGAVFSSDAAHNHVGIVLDYDEETDTLMIQEGNLDGISNVNWDEAIDDYRTLKLSSQDIRILYGNVTYAVPKEDVHYVGYDTKAEKNTGKKMKIKFKTLNELSQDRIESKIMKPARPMKRRSW